MAQVPSVGTPSVTPQGAQPYESASPPAAAFGETIGAAAEKLGMSGQQFADVLHQHAQTMLQLNAVAQADDAGTPAMKAASSLVEYFKANKLGADAEPAMQDYMDKIAQVRTDAASQLSPMAKRFFENNTRRLFDNMNSQIINHVAQQTRDYQKQSGISAMQGLADQIPLNIGSPDTVSTLISQIGDKAKYLAALDGGDATMAEQSAKKYQSAALKSAVDVLRTQDPVKASNFLAAYKDILNPRDYAAASSEVHTALLPFAARSVQDQVVSEFFGGAPKPKGPMTPDTLATIRSDPEGFFSRIAGAPVKVNSAERSPAHNDEVGGSKTSSHLDNRAWDLDIPAGMTTQQFAQQLANSGVPYDQIIEYGNHVHFGAGPEMRGEILQNTGPGKYTKVQGQAVGSSGIPHDLSSLQTSLPKMIERADQILDQTHADDPYLPQLKNMAESQIVSWAGRWEGTLKGVMSDSLSGLDSLLASQDAKGQRPTNTAELFAADSRAQAWYQNLSGPAQLAVQKGLQANANPSIAQMTPEQYNALNSLDTESKEHPDRFALRDPTTDPQFLALPAKYRLSLTQRQASIESWKAQNSELSKALYGLKPMLPDEVKDTPQTAEAHNRFIQAFSDEFKVYLDKHHVPPPLKMQRDMALELLQNRQSGNPGYEDGTFIPGWFGVEAQAQAKANNFAPLTDKQILQLYQRRVARGR